MAERLVSIYGTEKDRVNCPFYYKIGACRHGTRCSRVHNKPLFSPTLLLENLYQSPDQILASARAQNLKAPDISREDLDNHFDDFYRDVYDEMAQYGEVEQLHVCENLANHLAGNAYVKFHTEEAAQAALAGMRNRWYAGRPVRAEYSPVTDFQEGKCRPFERYGQCERGDYCHFMHLRRHNELPPKTRSHVGMRGDHMNRRFAQVRGRLRGSNGYEAAGMCHGNGSGNA